MPTTPLRFHTENLPPKEYTSPEIGGKRRLSFQGDQLDREALQDSNFAGDEANRSSMNGNFDAAADSKDMESIKFQENRSLGSLRTTKGVEEGFWRNFAKKARSVLLEDGIPNHAEEAVHAYHLTRGKSNEERSAGVQQGLQKGIDTIVGTLSMIGDSLGTALEEGIHKLEKASEAGILGFDGTHTLEGEGKLGSRKNSPRLTGKPGNGASTPGNDAQLKASRDVASAMARKAKQLLRELKAAHVELETCQERCAILEAENRRLREDGMGTRQEEDDLVRLQLETLLREKNRLAQENAALERGNLALQELIDYHHVKGGVLEDEEDDGANPEAGAESQGRHRSLRLRQPYWDDLEDDSPKAEEDDSSKVVEDDTKHAAS